MATDLFDTSALLLDSAGLKRSDFAGQIEVYASELTGRVVVVTRVPYSTTEAYTGYRFPFRVTHDSANENVIYFFDPIE